MGKVLGNYIHFNWDNYLIAGTYHVETRNDTQKYSDYDSSIFKNYSRVLRAHAAHKTLNVNNKQLRKLEQQINTERDKKFALLQQLNSTDKHKFLALVIKNANLGKDLDADLLANYIDLDPKTASINLKNKLSTASGDSLSLLRSGSYSTAAAIKKRIGLAYKMVNQIEDNQILKQELFKQVETISKDFKAYLSAHNKEVLAYKQVQSVKEKKSYKNTLNAVDDRFADFIIRELQNLLSAASLAKNLSKIKSSFAEIMGALAGNKALEIGQDVFIEELSKYLKGLTPTTGASNNIIDYRLNAEIIKPLAEKDKNRQIYIEEKTENGTWYRFKTDYSTQGKIDALIEFGGQPIGISVKAYDMSAIYGDKSYQYAIKLQEGTSLYMYLRMIQAQQFMPNIGNHFLNVFSQQGSKSGLDSLRQDANQALKMALLYDGLTGAIIKQGSPLAEILYIEDTSKMLKNGYPKIRLYSVIDLIQQASSHLNNSDSLNRIVEITPNIDSIYLKNEYIGEEMSGADASKRITLILDEARNKYKFSVHLKKEFLNNLYTPHH